MYELLVDPPPGDALARAIGLGILLLIALNVLALCLETVRSIQDRAGQLFEWFEAASVLVFSVEYVLRLWSAPEDPAYARPVAGRARFALTPMALVDLLAVLPWYLPLFGVDMRFMRTLRMLRLFRLAKLGRYMNALSSFGRVLRDKKEELVITLALIGILLVIASSLMYYVERDAQPEAFSSIPAALWWGVATLTTVGYGDIYPQSPLGRLLAAIIAILGVGLFAIPTGLLASGFVEELQRRRREGDEGQPAAEPPCPHCGRRPSEPSGAPPAPGGA